MWRSYEGAHMAWWTRWLCSTLRRRHWSPLRLSAAPCLHACPQKSRGARRRHQHSYQRASGARERQSAAVACMPECAHARALRDARRARPWVTAAAEARMRGAPPRRFAWRPPRAYRCPPSPPSTARARGRARKSDAAPWCAACGPSARRYHLRMRSSAASRARDAGTGGTRVVRTSAPSQKHVGVGILPWPWRAQQHRTGARRSGRRAPPEVRRRAVTRTELTRSPGQRCAPGAAGRLRRHRRRQRSSLTCP
mmetsp:Transcript_8054/g.32657  ORF Transcript_8054/g.32657 Transcript_8054/m.32657 type:complete len:253 (-) Transcript_8054:1187-1945(-)